MIYYEGDPVIAEVRRNRVELLAEFGGDTNKLIEHVKSQETAMEAAGFRYETEAEFEARKSWQKQRQEAEQRRVAAI